jgi:hypothetical protein
MTDWILIYLSRNDRLFRGLHYIVGIPRLLPVPATIVAAIFVTLVLIVPFLYFRR